MIIKLEYIIFLASEIIIFLLEYIFSTNSISQKMWISPFSLSVAKLLLYYLAAELGKM